MRIAEIGFARADFTSTSTPSIKQVTVGRAPVRRPEMPRWIFTSCKPWLPWKIRQSHRWNQNDFGRAQNTEDDICLLPSIKPRLPNVPKFLARPLFLLFDLAINIFAVDFASSKV